MGLQFLAEASWLERIFWLCAIVSSILFLIRTILMFIGQDSDNADSIDVDVDDVSSDTSFQVLSINSITAFFMMFGWIGLSCYKQFSMGNLPSILIALVAGIISLIITSYIFQAAKKLVSTGSGFTIDKTVGLKASVYQRIPANGKGKIQISIKGGMTREIDAISENQQEIESFQSVTVVKVIDPSTVSVAK